MEQYDAILPAGGRIDGEFAQKVGTDSKALIELGGRTVLDKTLAALQESGRVRRTVVIGSQAVLDHGAAKQASHALIEGASGPDNIFRGLDLLASLAEPPSKVLIVTTDLPFLKGDTIRRFLDLAPKDVGIALPLIAKHEFLHAYPNTKALFVKLRDGAYTAGCAYLLDTEALRKARSHIEKVFENRKSKMGMAKLIGPVFVLKWLSGRLAVGDVEKKVESILGVTGSAVRHSPPELAFDIDYLEDYDQAVEYLSGSA